VSRASVVNNNGTASASVAPNGDASRRTTLAAGAGRIIEGGDIDYVVVTNLSGVTTLDAGDIVLIGEAFPRRS